MSSLTAEVVGLFDHEGDANKLLYTPLDGSCTFRQTRRYELEYEGDADAAEAFVRRTLVDEFAEEVHFNKDAALDGYAFYLDYWMKPGALDLEKEAILASHRGAREKRIEITSLKLTHRIYIISDAAQEPARFIRDVCNPAIHVWSVTDSNGRNVA